MFKNIRWEEKAEGRENRGTSLRKGDVGAQSWGGGVQAKLIPPLCGLRGKTKMTDDESDQREKERKCPP